MGSHPRGGAGGEADQAGWARRASLGRGPWEGACRVSWASKQRFVSMESIVSSDLRHFPDLFDFYKGLF